MARQVGWANRWKREQKRGPWPPGSSALVAQSSCLLMVRAVHYPPAPLHNRKFDLVWIKIKDGCKLCSNTHLDNMTHTVHVQKMRSTQPPVSCVGSQVSQAIGPTHSFNFEPNPRVLPESDPAQRIPYFHSKPDHMGICVDVWTQFSIRTPSRRIPEKT